MCSRLYFTSSYPWGEGECHLVYCRQFCLHALSSQHNCHQVNTDLEECSNNALRMMMIE